MNRAQQLKYQLMKELKLLNYADNTIATYGSCIWVFFCAHKKFNSYKSLEDVKDFLLTIKNANYHKQMVAAIHHFYRLVLRQPLTIFDIPYPRKTHYLPEVFSVGEVHALISSYDNIKHKAMIQLMYSCGLRSGEVVKILLSDIDSKRCVVRIAGAKGFKDRYVPIPVETIELLRSYYLQHKPKKFLFEGQYGEQYSQRSLQQVFFQGCRRIGVKKNVRPHTLRHSRATHLKDALVDIKDIKDFLGHNDIKTTEIYLQLSKQTLVNRIAVADAIISKSFKNVQLIDAA